MLGTSSPFYLVTRWISKTISYSFFREVSVVGLERVPVHGPAIFVCNHTNKFVDASVMMSTIPRSIRFLIASVSVKLPIIGRLATWAGAISVNRPQDMKYPGMGRVLDVIPFDQWEPPESFTRRRTASLRKDDLKPAEQTDTWSVVIGDHLTRFPLDIKKGDRLSISGFGSQLGTVVNIINDHQLIVKESLWRNKPDLLMPDDDVPTPPTTAVSGDSTPGTPRNIQLERSLSARGKWGFQVYPKVDQGDIYEAVSRALYEGHSICIFPEGGSHDRPDLLPLKPGVAIMALNAALMGVEDVLIIPVGIHYYERHKFGSRAVVEFGQPLPIDESLVSMYAGDDKKGAVELLMGDVKDAMQDCAIVAPDFDTIKAVELCASLYPPERMNLSTEKSHQLYSLFCHLFSHFQQDPATIKLKGAVLEYNAQLEANGVKDSEVWQLKQNAEAALLSLLEKLVILLATFCICLPQLICWLPFRFLLNWMTERHRREAMAKSTVKITGVDVIASYKILWMMVFIPLSVLSAGFFLGLLYCRTWLGVGICMVVTSILLPLISLQSSQLQRELMPMCRNVACLYRVIISELYVWRDREREVIFDRIDMQLRVRNYVKEVLDEGTLHRALSIQAFESNTPQSADSSVAFPSSGMVASKSCTSLTASAAGRMTSAGRSKKLMELQNDLERLIPFVLLDADTRRLLRLKDTYIPLVYRSALASREEIL
eukprot:Protomagalhaensia_sp_Gyna_25__1500@NODE_176_length_4608_cov_524_977895_g138_i0_p1_GENE_NODE_176_length_4608_cov_524_977895_g138_i0NODE_176_length_4608_cov_524_977895_g138_i0_p1_ORF_typecomplete_len714_score142_92Acyltransferase/PF01553_21/1_3e28Peptidase_M50B/PF13398_6/0_065Caveolin/PF01146_17/1_5_NODE_176_length_4608_cov_524_977895_g138_i010873228